MSTIYLPLEPSSSPLPSSPNFLTRSREPDAHVRKVIKNILKAKRIAVVCGAGISVQAGIPDFRSSEGLFQSLKKDNPTLASGKDLFDASVFNSEATTSLFCQMIAQLSELSKSASPTAFHKLLRALDDRGRLLRVYTQNIDALESKTGLTFGVPELDSGKRFKPRSSKGKADTSSINSDTSITTTLETPCNGGTVSDTRYLPENVASTSRLPSPPVETPRCIPLHGTLQAMHCQVCQHSFPLEEHLESLTSGLPPYCPECTALEETRQLIGKRSRGVGKLRPSVVLYNEIHKDGEEVGEVVRRDLVGNSKGKGRAGADLLLVVGTSLRVPGTKRIVREFSKAVRSRSAPSSTASTSSQFGSSSHNNGNATTSRTTGLATPTPSPRRTPTIDDEPPVKTIYLNFDFPLPCRDWEGVFDVWLHGDAQTFARLVEEEFEKEERAKEEKSERKRLREEAAEAKRVREAEEEEQRKRAEQEKLKKGKGAKGKSQGKKTSAKSNVAAKGKSVDVKSRGNKRKSAPEDEPPSKPAKRHKVQTTIPSSFRAAKTKPTNPKSKSTKALKGVKPLTIKIPPRPRYSYITPPNSQGIHWVPEVVIKPKASHLPRAALLERALSPFSPISPISPMSPMSPVSPMSPISPISSMSSMSSMSSLSTTPGSPLSPLSSPALSGERQDSSGYFSPPNSQTGIGTKVEWLYGSELSELDLDAGDVEEDIDVVGDGHSVDAGEDVKLAPALHVSQEPRVSRSLRYDLRPSMPAASASAIG
ncbi:unnamed protein product [Somion occarium]|uniref:Deacetylase sirtuin-type domain-containing protein n=1 Tax=Somion occarium TaxID=3059160 RepID=A0ABP1EA42_9APHY